MPKLVAMGLLALLSIALLACERQGGEAMVATANPHATEAAAEILRQGGSAVDAMVAAQAVLGLVEPQSSGLGGGAFLLHWSADDKKVTSWDGRETAPKAAGPGLFLGTDGKPLDFRQASIGGRPVGVPGAVALLWETHRRYGKLPWQSLFVPAIRLAEEGFIVSARLHAAIADSPELAQDAMARELYFSGAAGAAPEPVPAGHTLRNPAYAATLRAIARDGTQGFYEGEVALAILTAVNGHASNPGEMTASDLSSYRAVEREPVCRPYRQHRVCGMPPPSSGGLTTLMILGMLKPYHMEGLRPGSPTALHLIAAASRLAFADRDLYMADPDFVAVPVSGLLDEHYLKARARLIDPGRDLGPAEAGAPPAETLPRAAALPQPESGTSHLAVLDRWGNAVSLTTSVEQSFGAHIMAAGFVLNNQLTDFSFLPEREGRPVANRVEGGKRPRSSMSPTLVFTPPGELLAVVGSPGGSRIIGYVTQTIIGLIDWDLDMQAAIDAPHVINRNGPTEIEKGSPLEALQDRLKSMGHEVKVQTLNSGLHGIRVKEGHLDGGADRRREGTVLEVSP